MDRFGQDLRFAVRGFRRTPTFVLAVLAILGLGIGMAVAMSTAFQTMVVRRLPVADQDRIAILWTYREPGTEFAPRVDVLPDVRRASLTMTDIAGVVHWGAVKWPLVDGDRTIVLNATFVTSNYFRVLGVRPVLGRLLRADDEASGAEPVMVLSYGAWQSQFGGSLTIVGRRVLEPFSQRKYLIVGVAPPGLDYPTGVGAWTLLEQGIHEQIFAIARLAPGASIESARAEFLAVVNRLAPGWKLRGAEAQSIATAILGDTRAILIAMTAAAGLLLLIACVNVGTLFLIRGASRARELAVRRALGASYANVVRQLVVESALLAVAGGALGGLLAAAFLRLFVALAPPQLPRLDDLSLHGSLFGAAAGIAALSVLLFGVLPALATARVNLETPFRMNARTGDDGRRRLVRDWLVASQVALAIVMLSGAGLLARSLLRLERVPLGYRAEHLSIVSVAYDWTKYNSAPKMIGWGEQVDRRLRAIPGVTAATPILIPPFLGASILNPRFQIEGQTSMEAQANPNIPIEVGGSELFHTFETPILRGRGLLDSDRKGATPVVVLSESVARRFWPGQDALGKRIRFASQIISPTAPKPDTSGVWYSVVGVVGDTRFRSLREAAPMVFLSWRQVVGWQGYFAIRSSVDARGITAAIQRAVHEVNPTLALFGTQSMDTLLGEPLAQPRLSALLLTAFGAVALLLACVGLYSAMAATVREQTREIGIRIAIGATPANIRGSVLRRALRVSVAGTFVGLIGAIVATRAVRTLLFEVSPDDPVTLAAVSGVLLLAATLAAYLPARRATRIDPIRALKAD